MKYIYVLEMCRWADNNNHSYCSGVYSTFLKALDSGLRHSSFRANKYEPQVYMVDIDGDVHNIMCRSMDEANYLYKELTGSDWKEEEPDNE